MTDAASALADTSALPDYDGQKVARTTISIRNAGDGLSQGLAIEPQLLAIGSKQYVVLECDVDAHDHKRLKDAPNLLVLDQVLKAGTGTLIDADVVREAIAQQAEKIKLAQEAAKGISRIEFPDADQLQGEHDDGLHADGLVPDCPSCSEEAAQAQTEAEANVSPIGRGKRGT